MNAILLTTALLVGQAPAERLPTLTMHRIPDFAATPTIQSRQDGDWRNAATWDQFRLPHEDDVVLITHKVNLCGYNAGTCRALGIKGTFDLCGQLSLKDGLVYPEGTLILNPGADLEFRDIPCDTAADPEQFGTGMNVLGRFYATGTPKDAYLRSEGTIPAGSTQIALLQEPVGWEVGDELVIPKTDHTSYGGHSERRTIAAIDTEMVTLNEPLQHDHPQAVDADGKVVALPLVVNLTRSIKISSENPDGARGHMLFTERADVRLKGVQIVGLSRTKMDGFGNVVFNKDGTVKSYPKSQIGRYAVHWHHCIGPEMPPMAIPKQFELVDCVVDLGDQDRDLRWGTAVHQTSFGIVHNNVFWGMTEDGNFVTEDGNEIECRIDGNLAGGTKHGYWLYGFSNYFTNNIAVDCGWRGTKLGAGIDIGWGTVGNGRAGVPTAIKIPTRPGQSKDQWVAARYQELPLRSCQGNESIACMHAGFLWPVSDRYSARGVPNAPDVIVKDWLVWHCRNGIFSYYENFAVYDGYRAYGDPKWMVHDTSEAYPRVFSEPSKGFIVGMSNTKYLTVRNSIIHNYGHGIFQRAGRGTAFRLENTELRNTINYERGSWNESPSLDVVLSNVRFGNPFGADKAIDIRGSLNRVFSYGSRDSLKVESFNGVEGDDFEHFFVQQSPDYVVKRMQEPPEYTGLTVQQIADQFGAKLLGQIAPDTKQTRPRIVGWVVPVVVSTPDSEEGTE